MKITMLAFVLLFASISEPILGAVPTGSWPEAVLDTSGRKLRVGTNYYIVPDGPAQYGGGLDLASIGEKCPLDVVAVEGYQGQSLSFTPVNTNKKGAVYVSTDLNIEFSIAETTCPQSIVWKLDDYDYSVGQWFVTTGGAIGNPGRRTVRNWFKIEEYEDAYKLVYCPGVCRYCKFQCKDIGLYVDSDGNKRLALSDTPLKVQFQRD
ncbi:miraculin-like [Prosopis cineraria]|uniref:miraculin-like n=1 Tax=Prosopis cineraria TaxID=364024 RepID=UPI002410023B|nr:miraculin-like [Prosopis cineraria]